MPSALTEGSIIVQVVTKRAIGILIMFSIAIMLLAPACTAQYTLTTSVSPSGSGEVIPASGTYDDGTKVVLNVIPATGWVFSEWSVDATGISSPTTITMDGNKSVTACFKAPPTAEIAADSTTIRVGEEVSFNADSSTDLDNSIVSYEWDFGDGNTASGRTATHNYSRLGTYTAKLTVTDSDGLSDTAEIRISAIPWGVIKIEVASSSWLDTSTPYMTSDIVAGMLESQGFAVYDGSNDYDALLDIDYHEKKGQLYGPSGEWSISGNGTNISCMILLYDKAGTLLHQKRVTATTSYSVSCAPYFSSISECLQADAQENFDGNFNDSFEDMIEIAREALSP
jgi:PKD repeat protein